MFPSLVPPEPQCSHTIKGLDSAVRCLRKTHYSAVMFVTLNSVLLHWPLFFASPSHNASSSGNLQQLLGSLDRRRKQLMTGFQRLTQRSVSGQMGGLELFEKIFFLSRRQHGGIFNDALCKFGDLLLCKFDFLGLEFFYRYYERTSRICKS